MLNTLYNIAGGIALAVGALGASDDFDGAELAQNAFFGSEDEIEAIDEQKATTEEVLVVKDVFEWDEMASKVMEMSLTGSDELTDDEKLEIAVLTGDIPSDVSDNQEEVEQISEIPQSEGLSEDEFYSMLEQQFNEAMTALDSEEAVADSEPLVIENVQEELAAVELQPEDDVNAEKALEEAQTNAEAKPENAEKVVQVEELLEESFKEMEPWVVVHGLPDIPEEDMNVLIEQTPEIEKPIQPEQTAIEDVSIQDIPVMDSILVDVPEVDVPEVEESGLEDVDTLPFGDVEEVEAEEVETEDAETEEVETEEAEAEEVEAEEVEAEEAEAEEAEAEEVEAEEVEAEEAETEDADVEDVEEVEAEEVETEDADVEEAEADDDLIVEPLEDDAIEAESEDEALLIPSLEIPPAVVTEEQRAKISEEVDALVDQSDNFDSWIPRQIPVSGSVDDDQPQTKPEDDFIQEFSKKNVKESILENTGIDLK